MTASSQDHLQHEEQTYLILTQQAIQLLLERKPPDGAELAVENLAAEAALHRQYIVRRDALQKASDEPYFGRVDFVPDVLLPAQRIYIGRCGIRSPQTEKIVVHDWRAPVSTLFYRPGFHQVSYVAPGGTKVGDVALRRRFVFSRGHLQRFTDERPPTNFANGGTNASLEADAYLRDLLQQTREVGLRDIIATIQAEQDTLIRAPLETMLIVQGAAGSGKTSIALHRLSYLLYTFPEQLPHEQVLIIGPNSVFLASIAPLFPQLGIETITQHTFSAWAKGILGEQAPAIDSSAVELLEWYLDRTQDRPYVQAMYQQARLLSSLRMVDLFQAYFAFLQHQRESTAPLIEVSYQLPQNPTRGGAALLYHTPGESVSLTMSADQVHLALQQREGYEHGIGGIPHRHLREGFLARCLEWLWQRFTRTPAYDTALDSAVASARRSTFMRSMREKVERRIQEWWPEMSPANCIATLFGNQSLLTRVASALKPHQKAFTVAELALLYRPEPIAWTEHDLPLLCLMRLFLEGRPPRRATYVIIDEAQDRSALELFLLHIDALGMTLVGDLAQGVFAYRGIASWKEANAALGGKAIIEQMQRSYRSTFEISQLANHILERGKFAQPMPLAQPFERHGPAPQIQACRTHIQMAQEALHIAQQALASGKQSIAIITKTLTACHHLRDELDPELAKEVLLLDSPDMTITQPIVLLPVWLAKGLEFDVVIIIGAEASNYSIREADAKLLYVAITRALHEVTILHIGLLSALLAENTI